MTGVISLFFSKFVAEKIMTYSISSLIFGKAEYRIQIEKFRENIM